MFNNKQSAFSLLEILIALTVVAILSAASIPFYKNYVAKAKLNELFTLADSYKLKLAEQLFFNDNFPESSINDPSAYISKVTSKPLGNNKYTIQITANMGSLGISQQGDTPFVLHFIGEEHKDGNGIHWQCQVPNSYKQISPSNCTTFDA